MSKIREIMKCGIVGVQEDSPASEAAEKMRDSDVGAVVVTEGRDDDHLVGILTDRDIAVRVVASGKDARATKVGEICSRAPSTVSPDDEIDRAIELMRSEAVRRAPVVDAEGRLLGIVSLGDLAIERDRESVLGSIRASAPNRRAGWARPPLPPRTRPRLGLHHARCAPTARAAHGRSRACRHSWRSRTTSRGAAPSPVAARRPPKSCAGTCLSGLRLLQHGFEHASVGHAA